MNRTSRLFTTAFLLLLTASLGAATFTVNGPSTTNNDDSCDIGLFPAATLLLPYFEVGDQPGEDTTIFTITNTANLPQAVTVTLWTDRGYPVINFPVYLTGYDVQSINLYDIIMRGRIAPDDGTGSDVSPVGELSGTNDTAHDNPQLNESSCENLPVQVPQVYINYMRSAFTTGNLLPLGSAVPGCQNIGGVHENAVGYATVDVMAACTSTLPTDAVYFTNEIRYDNVLTGDYLQVDGTNDYAQGNPMVHIRAIPEGGSNTTHQPTNMPRTFYSHLQPEARRTSDGRQPLPATFAARWIDGGTSFQTSYKIWREVATPAGAACSAYAGNAVMTVSEIVRFDEDENPETMVSDSLADPPRDPVIELPATSRVSVADNEVIPANTQGAVGGWVYFNLDNGAGGGELASQNWIVISMRAEDRYSADMDAISLGNGCTPPIPVTEANRRNGQAIGPAPNGTP